MKTVELHKAFCSLLEEGVINVRYKDDVEIEIEDVVELRKVTEEMTGGKCYVSVYEAGNHTIITKEAREISSNDEHIKNRKALAIVVQSLAQRIISNFFMKSNKDIHPIKVFSSKTKALIWAKSHLN
ncbi:MAG: hypothetical protein H6589_11055 [Flavobacteriales bacterium]|nr:hypothetical protein [Flavobacteriales bacterium]